MASIESCSIPEVALLNNYLKAGTYTDCYMTDILGPVSHKQYVTAFYTTFVFKMERVILKIALSRPSTDNQAKQLADGSIDEFAAWHVEARSENQLLLSDFQGRTRSWLMVASVDIEDIRKTRLFFGSAVTPVRNAETEKISLGAGFSMLLGFHKLYSVLLLYSAKSNLKTWSI